MQTNGNKRLLLLGVIILGVLTFSFWDFFVLNWRDVLNVIAFVITIGTLLSTRNAAIAARDAARDATKKVQKDFAKSNAISVLTRVRAKIKDIATFQEKGDWTSVPSQYRDIRELLAELRGDNSALTYKAKEYVQLAVSDFARIEEEIQRQRSKAEPDYKLPQINTTITAHLEEFTTIEIDLRSRQE